MNLSLSRRRVLALVALTSILLITLDLRGNATINAAKRMFSTVVSPLEDAGRAATGPIKDAWRGIVDYDDLEQENDRLRQLVEEQQGESIAAQVALRDYQELLAANQLTSLSQYTKVTAQVLAYTPQNFQQTVEINQGSKRGIRVGMPVVNAAGLVGKVTSVTPDSAVVLLISDQNYSITVKVVGDQPIPGTVDAPAAPSLAPGSATAGGATDSTATTTANAATTSPTTSAAPTSVPTDSVPSSVPETTTTAPTTTAPATTTTVDIANLQRRELGALEGQGVDRLPVVRFLNNDRFSQAIQPGDLVATNGGTQSLAPADIVVGRVATVSGSRGAAGPTVEVEPAADLRQLNFVRVILYIPPIEAASAG